MYTQTTRPHLAQTKRTTYYLQNLKLAFTKQKIFKITTIVKYEVIVILSENSDEIQGDPASLKVYV